LKLLFDIGHPAHFHLLKNLIIYLKKNHHKIIVTSRNKDVTNSLLRHSGIEFICISEPSNNIIGMVIELIKRDFRIFKLHKINNFDASIGSTMSIAHLTALFNVPSYNLGEDDDDVVSLSALITFPFSTKIINPKIMRYKKWKKKRVFYSSYHELAYLHPNNFTPDVNILSKYNLKTRQYIILRLSSLNAYHDISKKGINHDLWNKIKNLCNDYTIVVSKEDQPTHKLEPWDMHHVLAFAKMVISDSQTMSAEAAVLGVPAIRYNSFVGRISYLEELEHKYKLTYGFKPGYSDAMFDKIKRLMNQNNVHEKWQRRRSIMLADKVDLNDWMIQYFTTFLQY
tara:strand:+ start:1049 stop:2068 length:1020 start_codon:yes stop_codon:yes gene_type:complete